ncbi:hypothetical protein CJ231_08110 [Hoylesella buccalis]|uniref:Uncharacterized protein n=2 Tax=Hoylesella buccalis TaxID=28127 RepID=A0A2N6QQ82_9BACT|nr:hypothetical protein CJ231_08110 [Hoylesella buccalis]
MPLQIKALFEANPQIGIQLVDYDYVGEAKEEDFSSFANTLYDIYGNSGNCVLVMYSSIMGDSRLVRKMFRFDLTGYNFEDEIRIFCVPITKKTIVFLGLIPVKTNEDFEAATRFLFSGIYDSQYFLLQFNSSLCDSQLVDLLKSSLLPIKNRYGDIQNICISMPVMYKNKSGVKILYPYGGTDFGSFMLFTF